MFDIDQLFFHEDEADSRGGTAMPIAHLALIGNALPRKCGLATFTSHVAEAVSARYPAMRLDHYAMDDGSGVEYPDDIITIDAASPGAYRDAAARVEASGAEAVWIQHEFGIFGGEAGADILELIAAIDLPLVVTLHTVTDAPSSSQSEVLRRIVERADHIVVMSKHGRQVLIDRYGVDPDHLSFVPHGVPDRRPRRPDDLKPAFGWHGHKVLMTFGLLAPDKGIRHMIEAMPAIVAAFPDAIYEVVGATHPNLVHNEGERCRESLIARAEELGIADSVRFVDRFVEQEELLDMLQASDIYVTPYLNMAQATSGTLAYAVAVGKPVIATPYIHAREILADDRGVIVPKADSAALAAAAIKLLSNDTERAAIADAAYLVGRTMLWPKVVEQALAPIARRRTKTSAPDSAPRSLALPLTAIERMSDGVGMLQHGVLRVPDRDHGYCIDDNARALMVLARRGATHAHERRLQSSYAAFIQHGWNPDRRRFRNFMSYDRRWLEEIGSDDSNGRTLWALGVAGSQSIDPAIREWATRLFDRCAPLLDEISPHRARAFAALGGHAMFEASPDSTLCESLLRQSAEQLMGLYGAHSRAEWTWFEPQLTYDNARLPEALLRAGQRLGDAAMIELGLTTLGWLVEMQTGPRGAFRPVGSNGFGRAYVPPLAFDQQPVEAVATIDAAAAAFDVTGDPRWKGVARHAFAWFFGDNDAGIPLADASDGSCYDGLMATGINRNQGAESILAIHLASLTMREIEKAAKQAGQSGRSATEARAFAVTA